MFDLFFNDVYSLLTAVFVVGMVIFIVLTIRSHSSISKWGRLVALFILVGTAISALSAMRDGYATDNAVFLMSGLQSMICSIAGGLIFFTGLICLFIKKQAFRKTGFYIISMLFSIQVLTIEVSRVVLMIGGA